MQHYRGTMPTRSTPLPRAMSRTATTDLRIDYLRPGLGKHFIATGSILRAGNKVAVSRMDLHNEERAYIATATGTYLVG